LNVFGIANWTECLWPVAK